MEVLRVQVCVGYVSQLLDLAAVELLDVAMLVIDHLHQALDLCLQTDHCLLTRHRGLDRETKSRVTVGTSQQLDYTCLWIKPAAVLQRINASCLTKCGFAFS